MGGDLLRGVSREDPGPRGVTTARRQVQYVFYRYGQGRSVGPPGVLRRRGQWVAHVVPNDRDPWSSTTTVPDRRTRRKDRRLRDLLTGSVLFPRLYGSLRDLSPGEPPNPVPCPSESLRLTTGNRDDRCEPRTVRCLPDRPSSVGRVRGTSGVERWHRRPRRVTPSTSLLTGYAEGKPECDSSSFTKDDESLGGRTGPCDWSRRRVASDVTKTSGLILAHI